MAAMRDFRCDLGYHHDRRPMRLDSSFVIWTDELHISANILPDDRANTLFSLDDSARTPSLE